MESIDENTQESAASSIFPSDKRPLTEKAINLNVQSVDIYLEHFNCSSIPLKSIMNYQITLVKNLPVHIDMLLSIVIKCRSKDFSTPKF